MLVRTSVPLFTAILVSLSAGAASPACAQTSKHDGQAASAVSSTVDFRSASWMRDCKVINNNQEEIAGVSDLIVDRGSGRVGYLIIKTGTTLGMGGRAVAIPYGSFKWEAADKDRIVLSATPEQLAQFPEYTPETWQAMKDAVTDDSNALRRRLAADAAAANDPYAGTLDTANRTRIQGTIRNVERVRTNTFGEQVVITVEGADGESRRVALGPSWYVNGSLAAPMRGDQVVVNTLDLPRDPDRLLVGTNLRSGERELELRDSGGGAAWALPTTRSGTQSSSAEYSRYLRLSDLPGSKIDCRGSECGKIHDIILDRNSGEIGFLSIDPNQNFLGIGDTKRLLPWSVATVMLDGTVRIDASKEMVLASLETPSDLATLNSGDGAQRVYEAYDVPAPRFVAPEPVSSVMPDSDHAWSAQGTVVRGIERDSTKTLSGKVLGVTEVQFEGGAQPASAIRIRMNDDAGDEELVLLGPVWYMANQKADYEAGDSITVEACRTTIDGRRYWLARSVECKDSRVVFMSGSDAPAWTKR